MKYKISLCISALCFLTAFLITLAGRTTGEEALASRLWVQTGIGFVAK